MKIIITGASRGIGYDTAFLMATRGGHEVLALSRNEERLSRLAEEVEQQAPEHPLRFLPFDLTQPDFPALKAAVEALGGLDILINNAGLLINKPFAVLTPDDWQRSFYVNIFGPVELIRFGLPWLKKSNHAHIVNISSMGGFQGSAKFPGLSAYSAGKAALSNLTECLAEELKEEGIKVNCLALGAVDTEMLQEAFPGMEPPVSSAQMAEYLSHFALTAHRFYNGKVLPVSVSTP